MYRRYPCSATVRESTSYDEAYALSADAQQQGYDRVVAAGGDGTVRAVISGVLDSDSRLPVGIIPIGSGNLLALELKIPRYVPRAVRVSVEGTARPVDIGFLPNHFQTPLRDDAGNKDSRL